MIASKAAEPAECETGVGGTKFEVEGSGTSSHVCNGKNGSGGGKTLGAGETETGTWGFNTHSGLLPVPTPISFTIPLATPLKNKSGCGAVGNPCVVSYLKQGETNAGCKGTVDEPTAEPGNLCIYDQQEAHVTSETVANPATGTGGGVPAGVGETGTSGAMLWFEQESGEAFALAIGSWAVTAPAA